MQAPISTTHPLTFLPYFTLFFQNTPSLFYHIAFSALFLLFFAFSTQHLTLAAEIVVDTHGNPVVPGIEYRILDAQNHTRGIEVDQVGNDTCATTVIIGSEPKSLILHQDDDSPSNITLNEKTSFEFAEVSHCAEPGKWNVSIPGGKKYPVVIGPTDQIVTMPGWFEIAKSDDSANEYYINFKFGGKDDYALMISPYENHKDFYRMVFAPSSHDKNFTIVFEPSTPPPMPSPPPPTPSPPPPSTFVPLIRKIVR